MKISSDISYVISCSVSWRSHLFTWLQQPHKSFLSLYACLDCTFSSCAEETQIPVSSLLPRVQDIYKCLSDLTFHQLCLTLCDPMNCSTPGLPVHHQLPEFTQTHIHQVGDAIQPSHPLSSPLPPAPSPSQHQSLFR